MSDVRLSLTERDARLVADACEQHAEALPDEEREALVLIADNIRWSLQ